MVNTVINEEAFLFLWCLLLCEAVCGLKCLGDPLLCMRWTWNPGGKGGDSDDRGARRAGCQSSFAISVAPFFCLGSCFPTHQLHVLAEMTPELPQLGQATLWEAPDTQPSVLSGAWHSLGAVTILEGPDAVSSRIDQGRPRVLSHQPPACLAWGAWSIILSFMNEWIPRSEFPCEPERLGRLGFL